MVGLISKLVAAGDWTLLWLLPHHVEEAPGSEEEEAQEGSTQNGWLARIGSVLDLLVGNPG